MSRSQANARDGASHRRLPKCFDNFSRRRPVETARSLTEKAANRRRSLNTESLHERLDPAFAGTTPRLLRVNRAQDAELALARRFFGQALGMRAEFRCDAAGLQ